MKKQQLHILFLSMLLTFLSCENESHIPIEIEHLKNQKISLKNEVDNLSYTIRDYQRQISILNDELKVLNIYKSGYTPKYIVKIHMKQMHYSLSISKQLKDAMNAIEFELPVDKEFYNTVSLGTEIVDDFRVGSLFLKGSVGKWNLTIVDKDIR